MERIIPNEAFLVKEGLYVHEKSFKMGERTYETWELYSDEGWCFYDLKRRGAIA